MKTRSAIAAFVFIGNASVALADDCNIADVLFGKVRVEQIPFPGYEVGIIFGNDFDNKRFAYDKILGQVFRDHNFYRVYNVNGALCAYILPDLRIDTSDATCGGCESEKGKASLRRVTPNALAVIIEDGSISGTIEGRLPK